MIQDRVYGVKETMYHDPYYQRNIVGTPRVLKAAPGRFECEANYAVFRTKLLLIALALANALVDNKVAALDEKWSGLRLVIRLRDR